MFMNMVHFKSVFGDQSVTLGTGRRGAKQSSNETKTAANLFLCGNDFICYLEIK